MSSFRSLPCSRATLAATFLSLAFAACSGGGSKSTGLQPPTFSTTRFTTSATVTNPWFPLVPGTSTLFRIENPASGDIETIVVEVLTATRIVNGIACAVVRDRVYEDDRLLEDTHDWYAEDQDGNVWYMGEEVDNYEYDENGNVVAITHDGAWEAGRDVAGRGVLAQPGWLMPAAPRVGQKFLQEYYRGIAEDTAEVVALDAPVTLVDGTTVACLQIRDASQLDPTSQEFKFFAPGIGKVREQHIADATFGERLGSFRPGTGSVPSFAAAAFSDPEAIDHPYAGFTPGVARVYFEDADESSEVVVVERLAETKTVLGIACAVVRDRVYRDGVLREDTRDWYAQDDAGNVWYMGEAVDNYRYDAAGNLVEIDHDGSWEAGLDVAGVGSVAQAGFFLPTAPERGDSYHQEYYVGEAIDMGYVVATDAEVELPDGRTFAECLQVLDWNPLEPDGIEFKFFAPGHGLVHEAVLHDGGSLDHKGSFPLGPTAVPDFAAATFVASTTVTHPFFPLPAGGTWNYEKPTDEGLETIVVTVQTNSRIVLGIACVEALYEKRLDGVLHEVARDWYAQDSAGNVWYMGEAVDNYEYDELGNLLGINHDGSWEAGLDIQNLGQVARPGLIMPAVPTIGLAHYQEYYATAAEDIAFVVATGLTLVVAGQTRTGCLQTLDWTPLEPDALEYKYYAPGLGLVREHRVGASDETSELTGSSQL